MLQFSVLLRAGVAAATQAASGRVDSSASPTGAPDSTVNTPLQFHSHGKDAPAAQRDVLRQLITHHEAAVQNNAHRRGAPTSTYAEDCCVALPHYQLVSLPVTTGGVHRAHVRAALTESGDIRGELDALLLEPWRRAGSRCVVVAGCKSVAYLRRQLATDDQHTFLVVDHSLKSLANAAAALVKEFGPRVHFLRSEAMFTFLAVLPRASVDAVVVPMPAPFWSEKGSYRRLLTSEFFGAAHRALRERTDAADPRGLVAFTDCEPYADFMVEQLMEAKLLVPWARKNPAESYGRWLPLSAPQDGAARPVAREFAQQRFDRVVAVAASKNGPSSPQALAFIEGYDYKRRYYRTFNDGGQS